jgi:hypothetical protein
MGIASNLSFEDMARLVSLLKPETGFTLVICDSEGNLTTMPSPEKLSEFNTFRLTAFIEKILERLASEIE